MPITRRSRWRRWRCWRFFRLFKRFGRRRGFRFVAAQQSYAVAVSVVETVPVPELIDDALRMSAGSLARQAVTVIKEVADLPLLSLDRHRVLLILVNLINGRKPL